MIVALEHLAPLIHISLFAMLHRPNRRSTFVLKGGHPRRQAERHLALFCHLARVLRQISLRIPWQALSKDDWSAASAAIPLLEEALETAKAAASQDWSQEDRQPSPAIRTRDQAG